MDNKEMRNKLILAFSVIMLLALSTIYIRLLYNGKKKEVVKPKSNLTEKQKVALGVSSNSNSNSSEVSLKNKIDEEKKKIEEEKKSEEYKKYEQLSEEEKSKSEIVPEKKSVDIDKLDDLKKDNEEKTIPSKYNLADEFKLNYESQEGYGICWDFAGIKSVETYSQLHNLGSFNFSEIAVDYVTSREMFGSRELHDGGFFKDVANYSIINNGFVETKNLINKDYNHNYTEDEYFKFVSLKKQPIIITEIATFPTLRKSNGSFVDSNGNKVDDTKMKEYRELMKKHIMTNGSLYAITDSNAFNHGDAFYYDEGDNSCNHAISIVGWDDNYPKNKINKIAVKDSNEGFEYTKTNQHPSSDGAFIVVNSWSINKNITYISYEDSLIYSEIRGVKSTNFENSLNVDKINNEKLKKALLNKYHGYIVEQDNNRYIPYSITSDETALELNNLELTNNDLWILKYFDSLINLNLNDNNLTSLNALKTLKDLIVLSFNNNNVVDVTPLASLKELNSVEANNNDINDISVLKNTSINIFSFNNNEHITGYNELFSNIKDDDYISLHLSGCNIGEFTNNKIKYASLDLSDNENITLSVPLKVAELYLKNNNINDLSLLDKIDSDLLLYIDLSYNDIRDVQKLTKYNNITKIDLSSNKNITNISELKKVYIKREPKEDMFMYNPQLDLILNETNITDLSLFNDFYINGELSLKNNGIKSVSKLNNSNISSFDLSGNKFEDTSYKKLFNDNITSLYLSDCNISDLSGISIKDDSFIDTIDLSNNNIKDITPLSKIRISVLSLANNASISGKLPEVNSINLTNCKVNNNTFDINDLKTISLINFSNNKYFTDYNNLINNSSIEELYVNDNDFDYSSVESIDSENDIRIIGDIKVNYKRNDNIVNLNNTKLRKQLINGIYFSRYNLDIENCSIDKYVNSIKLDSQNLSCNINFNYFDDLYSKYIVD